MTVLFVCYANQCRSPMAEALLRGRLESRHPEVVVASAGLLPGGVEAAPHAVAEMARRGLDLAGHRSRRVDAALIEGAELVLTMTRAQVGEIAVVLPGALRRTMTLPEAVRRAQSGPKRRDDQSLADWAARLTADRRPVDVLKAPGDDDVADPMGGRAAGFVRTADRLDQLLRDLVASAFG